MALLCAGLFVPSIARASAAAVIVVGKAQEHDREVVASAIRDVLRAESWSIREQPIEPAHEQAIVRCLGVDQPWRCLAPTARALGVDRIVLAQVEPEKVKEGVQLVVTAKLAIPGNGIPPFERQVCVAKCTEPALVAVSNDIAKALLRGLPMLIKASTTLEVQTDPSGATVLVDGQPVGRSNDAFSVAPGTHQVAIELSGFKREVRTVTLAEGEMQPLALTLVKEAVRDDRTTVRGRPWLVPAVVAGGGAALVIAGSLWQASTDPPDTFEQPTRLYNKPAIATIAVGSVAIGVGAYLWFARTKRNSAPTVSLSRDGGTIGWSGTY